MMIRPHYSESLRIHAIFLDSYVFSARGKSFHQDTVKRCVLTVKIYQDDFLFNQSEGILHFFSYWPKYNYYT